MAEIAGMTLRDRWSGWRREPFTSESRSHVSVWERGSPLPRAEKSVARAKAANAESSRRPATQASEDSRRAAHLLPRDV